MLNEKWDRRFLRLAEHVASWSKDPSSQIGAVLVTDDREIVGIGYNGFPRGVGDQEKRYLDRDLKYGLVVHAEINAILNAGHRARGAHLYVWPAFGHPNICSDCCKAAVNAGIKRLVGLQSDLDPERLKRWGPSLERSALMLTEAGIPWTVVKP